jgi:two-component system KDP operon response regulator KdpE
MPSVEEHDRGRYAPNGHGPVFAIIDEDPGFSRLLGATLEAAGYRASEFRSYTEFELNVAGSRVDAIVLDLAAPKLDRLAAIHGIRAASEAPILVATERADELDKICALDAGADDYLIKPLSSGEFLARVRVALRHGRARRVPHSGRVAIDELSIDLLRREVSVRGARLALTPTDYKLLALLARNLGRVVPHEQLLREAWGPHARDPHYLRVYMARLRRKLDPERAGLRYIVTEPGVGYRLLAALRG